MMETQNKKSPAQVEYCAGTEGCLLNLAEYKRRQTSKREKWKFDVAKVISFLHPTNFSVLQLFFDKLNYVKKYTYLINIIGGNKIVTE